MKETVSLADWAETPPVRVVAEENAFQELLKAETLGIGGADEDVLGAKTVPLV